MPEGDTLFKIAQTLARALEGQVVTRFETGLAQLARSDRDAPIAGRTVERVEPRGKFLLIRFSGGLTLRSHLRMNGAWHLYKPGERWQLSRTRARVVIETATRVVVGFDLPVADFLSDAQLARDVSSAIGPDLLSANFDAERAFRNLRALPPATEVADALLDQRAMAGLGNVYKSELLFLERVHPQTSLGQLDDLKLRSLIATARKVMRANTSGGPRQTTRRRDEPLFVYGRAGKPCRHCGAAIAQMRQGPHARVTSWCPACQHSH